MHCAVPTITALQNIYGDIWLLRAIYEHIREYEVNICIKGATVRNVTYKTRSFIDIDLGIKAACLPLRMYIYIYIYIFGSRKPLLNICGSKANTHWVISVHGVQARIVRHLIILFMHLSCNRGIMGSSTDPGGTIFNFISRPPFIVTRT